MAGSVFPSEREVIRCLLTYTDWWQVPSSSVLQAVGARRGDPYQDGFRSGLLESLDQRAELCRRIWQLEERDRRLLFLWYVHQVPVEEIARAVGISRRHCFRRRARAVRAIVDPRDEAA